MQTSSQSRSKTHQKMVNSLPRLAIWLISIVIRIATKSAGRDQSWLATREQSALKLWKLSVTISTLLTWQESSFARATKTSPSSSSSHKDSWSLMRPECQWPNSTQRWPIKVLCSESRPHTAATLEPSSRTNVPPSTWTVETPSLFSPHKQPTLTSGTVSVRMRSNKRQQDSLQHVSPPSQLLRKHSPKAKKMLPSGIQLVDRESTASRRKAWFAQASSLGSSTFPIRVDFCSWRRLSRSPRKICSSKIATSLTRSIQSTSGSETSLRNSSRMAREEKPNSTSKMWLTEETRMKSHTAMSKQERSLLISAASSSSGSQKLQWDGSNLILWNYSERNSKRLRRSRGLNH